MTIPKMSRTMTVAITREADWYVARCLQVEVTTQARTVEEALANLKEALELYFANDAPVPPPIGHALVTEIEISVPA